MKYALFIFAFIFSQILFSQKLSLTPMGLRDSSNIDNSYVVVLIDNKMANDLYSNALKFIIKNYKSPNKVIQGQIENEYIKFETFVPNISVLKTAFASYDVSCLYTTELSFKNEKFKYEIISMDLRYAGDLEFHLVGSTAATWPIYNRKLELVRPTIKQQIEDYFNDQIKEIRMFITDNNSGDW